MTVHKLDRRPPTPRKDITGLSLPSAGSRLIGVLVRVCNGHDGAIGAYDFSLETSGGDAKPKFSARNYRRSFKPIREGCGSGWIVFEAPADSKPEMVKFAFDDTGQGGPQGGDDELSARFEWKVE